MGRHRASRPGGRGRRAAIGRAEPDAPVFGRFSFPVRYPRFRAWVNGPGGRRLRAGPDPRRHRDLADAAGHPSQGTGLPSRRPARRQDPPQARVRSDYRGLRQPRGGAQAKLLAEIGEHEAERNLQLVLTEFRNYQDGVMPAGPGARELTEFFATVDGDLAGHAGTRRTCSPATSMCSTCSASAPERCTWAWRATAH